MEQFLWLAKSIYNWLNIEAAAEKNNEPVANAIINIDDLFDEAVFAKAFWLSRCAEWKLTYSRRLILVAAIGICCDLWSLTRIYCCSNFYFVRTCTVF